MEIKGEVVIKKVYVGTKSEHEGVCLKTENNSHVKLRLPGGNPFVDPKLVEWVGKKVTIKGDFFKPVTESNPTAINIFMCNEIKEG
jgi:hypothetical protein